MYEPFQKPTIHSNGNNCFFFKACVEASAEPPRSLRSSQKNIFFINASLRGASASLRASKESIFVMCASHRGTFAEPPQSI